jgi:hypothetical protein
MNFRKSVAKYVRPEFINNLNDDARHWMTKKVEPNKLAK